MVPTVAHNKATSKLYSFHGRFMMSAARLTAGMLTQLYQWHLHLEARTETGHTPWIRPHTECWALVLALESTTGSRSPTLNASFAFSAWFCGEES